MPEAAFQFEVPKDAKLVKRLLGPAPSPPSKLLGQPAPEFAFTTIEGQKLPRAKISRIKWSCWTFGFHNATPARKAFR